MKPVPLVLGWMRINQAGRIIDFSEKPKDQQLRYMQVDTKILGLSSQEAAAKPYIASMGIYLFKRDALFDLLICKQKFTDFGKEIIPYSLRDYNVQAYLFDDYWEDIGTIDSFFKATLALAHQPDPPFSFYNKNAPIYTRARYLPPTKQLDCQVFQSMISEGCILKRCQIFNSVIGIRSRIESGCTIHHQFDYGS